MPRFVLAGTWTLAAAMLLLASPGCSTYSRTQGVLEHKKAGVRVSLPTDWLVYRPDRPALTLTRDGLRLERITISVTRHGEKAHGTERAYRAGMLPHEIAELSLGILANEEATKNFEIERVEMVSVAGRDGYSAEAVYVDGAGLPMRLRMIGFHAEEHVCELRFVAADAAYFKRYAPVFDAVVASVQRTGPD